MPQQHTNHRYVSHRAPRRENYRTLRQGERDFSTFWAEFQRLAAELGDVSKDTLIADLIEKSHYAIQRQLATGEADPTDLTQLAKRCQRIEQSLKTVNKSQVAQEKYAARKTGISSPNTRIATTSGILPAASPSPTTMRTTHLVQPRGILPAPSLAVAPSTSAISRDRAPPLTDEEREILRKFGRCFNCKQEGQNQTGFFCCRCDTSNRTTSQPVDQNSIKTLPSASPPATHRQTLPSEGSPLEREKSSLTDGWKRRSDDDIEI